MTSRRGNYQLNGTTSCQWTLLRDFKGEYNSTWASGTGDTSASPGPFTGSLNVPAPSPDGSGNLVYSIAGVRCSTAAAHSSTSTADLRRS